MIRDPFPLILDSGAVSFYNKEVKKNTRGAPGRSFKYRANETHNYADTKEFKKYRQAYIEYVLKNDKFFSGYINLDVINNAQSSYDQLKFLESKGCHPLPVYHISSEEKWLKRYVDEGYEWICMGGIVPNRYSTVRPILDHLWKDILTDKDGMPRVKVHGLAVTSFYLLKRYPWWTTDSASWRKAAAFGKIFIPRPKTAGFEGWNFDKTPCALKVTYTPAYINHRDYHSMSEKNQQ